MNVSKIKILDVLPPYEDEFLYSWIYRMASLYAVEDTGTAIFNAYKTIFGNNTFSYSDRYYFTEGLQSFVTACDLNNSSILSSEESIKKHLSVIPFYEFFANGILKNNIEKSQCKNENIRKDSQLGLITAKGQLEGGRYLKVCPQCLSSSPNIYLKKEHQIKGNYICYEHGCALKILELPTNRTQLFNYITAIEKNNMKDIELQSNDFVTATAISNMIHSFFKEGFKEDFKTIKMKLFSKLLNDNVIDKNGDFLNIDKFCKLLDVKYLYKHISLKNQLKKAIIYGRYNGLNPIIYLILIFRLFGSLENLYIYKHDESLSIDPLTFNVSVTNCS